MTPKVWILTILNFGPLVNFERQNPRTRDLLDLEEETEEALPSRVNLTLAYLKSIFNVLKGDVQNSALPRAPLKTTSCRGNFFFLFLGLVFPAYCANTLAPAKKISSYRGHIPLDIKPLFYIDVAGCTGCTSCPILPKARPALWALVNGTEGVARQDQVRQVVVPRSAISEVTAVFLLSQVHGFLQFFYYRFHVQLPGLSPSSLALSTII